MILHEKIEQQFEKHGLISLHNSIKSIVSLNDLNSFKKNELRFEVEVHLNRIQIEFLINVLFNWNSKILSVRTLKQKFTVKNKKNRSLTQKVKKIAIVKFEQLPDMSACLEELGVK